MRPLHTDTNYQIAHTLPNTHLCAHAQKHAAMKLRQGGKALQT